MRGVMQYRILDRDGNIVAWLDTEQDNQLVHNDYILEIGEHLKSIEVDHKIAPIIDISHLRLSRC